MVHYLVTISDIHMYLLIYKNKRPHRIENLFKIFTDTKNINNSDSTAVAKSADIT